MAELTGSDGALAVADFILAEVRATLDPTVERVTLTLGEIVADTCEYLQIAIMRYGVTSSYPLDDVMALDPRPSDLFTVAYQGQVARCWPSDDVPSVTVLSNHTAQIMADGYKLHTGMTCALAELQNAYSIVQHNTQPLLFLPPSGGMAVATVDFSVALTR